MKAEKLFECLVTGGPKPISDEQIAGAEKMLNLRFPSEFKRFVVKWNGVELDGCDSWPFMFYMEDIADLKEIRTPEEWKELYPAEQWDKEPGEDWKDAFPGFDRASVDLFAFAGDCGEAEYILAIDKKNPERFWIVETYETVVEFCVNSIPAFLNKLLISDRWNDDRTPGQMLADRIHGEKPTQFMTCRLEDAPDVKEPEKIGLDMQDFVVVMPSMGYGIQMKRVPADANGSRPFWISRFPVANNRFYQLIDLIRSEKQADEEKYEKAPAEVSAADAETYCAILNDFFAKSLPDGYAFALPTDAEYQQALKHADEVAEKPKNNVFCSILKLFVRPNPGSEYLTKILLRDRDSGADKLPFYIVLTSKTS